ncbi:MAG: SCO family protein [Syntrophobacteraceae bacterium]|jgi:cytochrome oxidase Cu insertion factor (SCO1/SenC/PrrC family)|nr:SCO family protein [Syntrophobacteraceae bacterium]
MMPLGFRRAIGVTMLATVFSFCQPGVAGATGQAGSIWGADYFPNIPLITHEGKEVRFFDDLIKDKVVVINFIFTRCPDVCPLETARLREVQKILGDRVGKDVFIYSISIDPDYDKPHVLKAYAERYQIGPGWLFLTGSQADIVTLRRKLGMYNPEERGGNLKAHTLSLLIGNQSTGRWMRSSPFENPYVMATQVGSWLHNWKLPPREGQDYASAPQVRSVSPGENLFRTRCSACHTVGGGDVVGPNKEKLGPDLFAIGQKRERGWLIRFIKEPDRMIAEGDPLSLALLEAYDSVPMPNLSLNDADIEHLLRYIEEESRRKGAPESPPGTIAGEDGGEKRKGEP